jgi:hypothetical protein
VAREYDIGGSTTVVTADVFKDPLGRMPSCSVSMILPLPYAEETTILRSAGNNAERYHVYKVEHYFPDSVRSPMIAIMLERKHSHSHTRPWHAGACSRSSFPRP